MLRVYGGGILEWEFFWLVICEGKRVLTLMLPLHVLHSFVCLSTLLVYEGIVYVHVGGVKLVDESGRVSNLGKTASLFQEGVAC